VKLSSFASNSRSNLLIPAHSPQITEMPPVLWRNLWRYRQAAIEDGILDLQIGPNRLAERSEALKEDGSVNNLSLWFAA
jgi:hypothetical protein